MSLKQESNETRLKGSVRYARTVNLGNFSSLKVDWEVQFFLDEKTLEDVTLELERRLKALLDGAGLT